MKAESHGATSWRRSSFCSADNGCVEVGELATHVAVRDSKHAEKSPVLLFDRTEWQQFIAGVKAGEFDHLV